MLPTRSANIQVSWAFFRDLCSICVLCFKGDGRSDMEGEGQGWLDRLSPAAWVRGTLFLLFAMVVGQTFVVSKTGDVISGFYTSISSGDAERFWEVAAAAFGVTLLSALLESTIKAVVEWLAWQFRSAIGRFLQQQYFSGIGYYRVLPTIDNPDQRITTDCDQWASTLAAIISQIMTAPLIIAYYSVTTVMYIAWYAPLLIILWFSVGYLCTKLIMGPISRTVFRQDQLEGDFRFGHAKVRSEAESIAIYAGGATELEHSTARFGRVLKNKLSLIRWQWGLNSAVNFFSYVTTVINYTIVALPVLFISSGTQLSSDQVPGYVAKAAFEIIMLASGFSTFLNISGLLSDLSGYTARLTQLISALPPSPASSSSSSSSSSSDAPLVDIDIDEDDNNADDEGLLSSAASSDVEANAADLNRIELQHVLVETPDGVVIARDLSFLVERGHNMLIVGPSGVGKSSLVRVLSGLWQIRSGSMHIPPRFPPEEQHAGVFFLPQSPYFFLGTVVDQIAYPVAGKDANLTAQDVWDLLELVQMTPLLLRSEVWGSAPLADAPPASSAEPKSLVHWTDTLSPGERQRLAFARLFFHRPCFAVLDEATSSLSLDMEARVYQHCQTLGITLLSIAHRPSLFQFHQTVLRNVGPAAWSVCPVTEEHADQ